MRLKWWQAGLHLEAESQEDRKVLSVIYDTLEKLNFGWTDLVDRVELGVVGKVETDHEESVTGGVHDAPKVVS